MRDATSPAMSHDAVHAPAAQPERVPGRVYVVMALTMVLTFATLTTGYQLFFTHSLYA